MRILGTLGLMLVSGLVTGVASGMFLMQRGLSEYGNYEYYGLHYPALTWAPAAVGFIAPAIIVWFVTRRRNNRREV